MAVLTVWEGRMDRVDTLVDEIALDYYHRVSHRFVQEAIAEWDITGGGYFYMWILRAVSAKWLELIRSN